ncbi:hypothetical protein [uncultured Fluviicola sp.]|uniref:hypothetical protein n=1 Tax=uncultured Fluviicola sp. TaxID=463303 RepID=UPI0025FD6E57|nr:hypothetical protein [uncultured Fluviicola sp.]
MKKFLKFVLPVLYLVSACSDGRSQSSFFEGRMTFKNEFVIKSNKTNLRDLEEFFGLKTEFFFKDGNFLERYDSGYMLEQLYLKEENRTYFRKDKSDTLYWLDSGLPGQKIRKIEINPKKEKILGIECDEMITYYDNKTVSYYFNSDTLRINPDWYKNFTSTNKHLNSRKMKAIYLKYKIENADFIATVVATSISHQKVKDDLFIIPEHRFLVEDK